MDRHPAVTAPVAALPPPDRSALMSRVKKVDTRPELLLRSELHRRGLRFRVQVPVPQAPRRSIDVALTRARIAVFVDGCFWHGCPDHLTLPRHNRDWWRWKLATVRARDRDTVRVLQDQGWAVLRVWEHEDPVAVGEVVEQLWRARTRPAP